MTRLARAIRGDSLIVCLCLGACLGACGSSSASLSGPAACSPAAADCASNVDGYACTGGETPPETNPDLTCDSGFDDGDRVLFCCVDAGSTSTTTAAPPSCDAATIAGCSTPSFGFSCTGGFSPDKADPSLVCSLSGAEGGAGTALYCCTTGAVATCTMDPSVVGCSTTAVGYSCTGGSGSPAVSDSTLVCSNGVVVGSTTQYCCATR